MTDPRLSRESDRVRLKGPLLLETGEGVRTYHTCLFAVPFITFG